MRIAINGFGRIGRLFFRAAAHEHDLQIVAVNDLTDADTLAHLLKYDSVHGKFDGVVEVRDGNLFVNNNEIKVFSERDPEHLPWKELKVEVVVESTGFFRTKDFAGKHLKAGATRVLLSAPGKDPDIKTIVVGVNSSTLSTDDTIVSAGSCTTNCLAPVARLLDKAFGIEHGFLLTVHSYTSSQKLQDGPDKDLRRARAAGVNMIPTTTGASSAVEKVLPELKGKLDGLSVRVPTVNGSLVDFTATLEKDVTVEEVNAVFRDHGADGVLEYSELPLVLTDIVHNPHSSIFDAGMTRVLGKRMVKVMSWYDNEWGFSNRLVDILKLMAKGQ